jgi:hypothetical protein
VGTVTGAGTDTVVGFAQLISGSGNDSLVGTEGPDN